MKRSRAVFGLVAVWLLVGAGAAEPKRLNYLFGDSVRVAELLPAPPASGSAENQRDLTTSIRITVGRTEAELARAKATDTFSVFSFSEQVGTGFTAEKCPKTAAMFAKLQQDAWYFVGVGKHTWKRPRPYWASEQVKFAGTKDSEPGYPSGHATRVQLFALVLGEVLPDKKDALLDVARESSWDRVVLGAHYPSDVFAGRVLGQAIYYRLKESVAFQAEMDGVREEIKLNTGQLVGEKR